MPGTMTVIEISAGSVELTFRQRWSHYFVMIFGAVGLLIGLNLRDSVLYATTQYTNPQAGITAMSIRSNRRLRRDFRKKSFISFSIENMDAFQSMNLAIVLCLRLISDICRSWRCRRMMDRVIKYAPSKTRKPHRIRSGKSR